MPTNPPYPQPSTGSFNPNTTVNPNPNAPFDPNAVSTTDPGTTGVDLYGLSPTEEKWTFYLGTNQVVPQSALGPLVRKGYDQEPGNNPNSTPNDYQSALDIMKHYAAMGTSADRSTRQAFANLQYEMLAMGAYGTSGSTQLFRPGVWTDLDAQALLKVMRSYQQVAGSDGAGQPISFEEYINQAAAQAAANGQASGGGSGSGGLPSTPVLTDPDTLTMYAQRAAQAALGHSLSKDQLSAFINTFHQSQADAYQDAVKGNGPTVDKNDPRASAIAYVANNFQHDYQQHQIQGYTDAFLNMFLGGASAAPNVNVDAQAVSY